MYGPLSQITAGPTADSNPSPVPLPDGKTMLPYRSDRNVPFGRLDSDRFRTANGGDELAAPERVTVRRCAGSVSAVPTDAERSQGRGLFGELCDYTPPTRR